MTKNKLKKTAQAHKETKNYVVAKSDDGTIQITYTIPKSVISESQKQALEEIGKDLEIPGFRKGKAPISKVTENISKEALVEKTLNNILPKMFGETLDKEKIKPASYPRFEVLSANDQEDWQVRAVTCEIETPKLGDYKKDIPAMKNEAQIWTPEKGDPKDKPKELSKEEKESKVIQYLIENSKVKIPTVLIEEETNSKLSQLLARLEKLSLDLESYLKSVGKTPQNIRHEYEHQAKDALSLDLILNEVAKNENITVPESQIEEAVKNLSAQSDAKNIDTPEQRRLIESIIRRKMALDKLVALLI